jgi:hypothetical protein
MKWFIRRIIPIHNRTRAGENGSITLETALVMPVFLLLVFFLFFLIQTSFIAMSLHGTLSQTVRLAASSWYPVSMLEKERESHSSPHQDGERAPIGTMLGEYADSLPSPLKDWARMLSSGRPLEEEAVRLSLGELALQLSESRWLDKDRFHLDKVELPTPGDPAHADLVLNAEYRLPFRVPFTGRPLVIRAQVRERAWAGGSPSRAGAAEPGAGQLNVRFVSLEPNPVRPGRKATLVLRAEPGTVLDLSVLYKSGLSQAKHLGTATANESGLVTWTWHVSGNTTSGGWTWEVRSGPSSFSQPFQVKRTQE